MRMDVFPAMPVIEGTGPAGAIVKVVQYVIDGNIAGQIGPRSVTIDSAGSVRPPLDSWCCSALSDRVRGVTHLPVARHDACVCPSLRPLTQT